MPELLTRLLADAQEKPEQAADRVAYHIDTLFLDNEFETVNLFITDIDLSILPFPVLSAIITVGFHARDKLPAWNDFFARALIVYEHVWKLDKARIREFEKGILDDTA